MNFPCLVAPYHRPLLWYTPVSVLTQTWPLALADAISESEMILAGAGVAFVALALILVQAGKRSTAGRTAVGKRVCPLAMRYTARPIQSGAARLAKRGYD